MEALPEIVNKTERSYRQLDRNGHAALYEAQSRQSGKVIGYEAFRIKKVPTRRLFGSSEPTPAHEAYPSDEDFGKTAWAFGLKQRDQAEVKFRSIQPAQQANKPI